MDKEKIERELFEKLKNVSFISAVEAMSRAMEEVERYRDLPGSEKKKIVMALLPKLVEKVPDEISEFIDITALATKGELSINLRSCWRLCC